MSEISIGIEQVYDEVEYVSASRQKIRKLLGEWRQEIKQAKSEQLSQQKARDIKREIYKWERILNILAEVVIEPKIDPTAPCHQEQGTILY